MLNKRIKTSLFMTIFLVIFSILINVNYVFADVSRIVFFTDIQTIPLGQVSGPITIQVQDLSGNEQKANETIYFNLISSGNGEFSSNKDTWKPLATLPSDFSASSVYIASSSVKRTFYYKGLSEGNHVITVFAKSKSGKSFGSIIQSINIGNQVTTPSDGEDPIIEPNTSNTGPNNTIPNGISLHSSEEDLSDYNDGSSLFEISAGRERITYIGVPIEFVAKYKIDKSIEGRSPNFSWSFGDGISIDGEKVVHSYKFLGDYNVVLNAEIGDKKSVSRTSVKVLSPDVSIKTLIDGDIEVKNNGRVEINLGGWVINVLLSRFVFPKDTIVGPGKSIILSKDNTKIIVNDNDLLRLINPTGGEVVSVRHNSSLVLENSVKNSHTIEDILGISQEKAESLILDYKKSLVEKNTIKSEEKVVVISTAKKADDEEVATQTASVVESTISGNSTSTSGFWNNFVGRGLKSFARIFYDF
ncbi:MAG: PKD domain-containing protein [Candidatus Taylorbacteria bacterium]|nr:PKD domain-containing protein [Candidatus Taylorbacteria bacterium]